MSSTVDSMAHRAGPAEGVEGPQAAQAAVTARERLMDEALRLFASQGYAETSVREIAEAAQVNVAAIRYYFGDKAGLYRAAFFEPMDAPPGEASPWLQRPEAPADADGNAAGCPIAEAALRATADLPAFLALFFDGLLAPLHGGERARQCMRLHLREMLEPTGLWEELVEREIRPMHTALLAALQAHLGLAEVDDELRRLTATISGLGVHLHVGAEVIGRLEPTIAIDPATVGAWSAHLQRQALAIVEAEARRRQGVAASPPTPPAG